MKLLDSATSIGANLEEAQGGQTKPDFIAKNFIALKEAPERVHRHADGAAENRAMLSGPRIAESAIRVTADMAA